ncbi:MAG TPA: lysoplasmalogenase [Acidimicrobiales bacterium]|jgi:uncharacterized membrane protein YhhN|nr:lysoplasmalogenase [Acidimicrobiales bacterium]
MTASAWALLVIAAGFAVGDWIAVATANKRLEYACKPLTILFLMGLASALEVDDHSTQNWFLLALGLSLVGDVLLMLPRDRFVFGLGAFLLAHLAYIVGLWTDGVGFLGFVIGLAIAGLSVVFVGGRVVTAIDAGGHRDMATPVRAYMAAISLMLASAIGTAEALAIAGAALFYVSDALIAWERFVRPRAWHGLAIIVTYHLAQASLTLSLVT